MTRRAFGCQLAVLALALAAGALAEAGATASRLLGRSFADAALAAVWALGLCALPAALVAIALAWLLAALLGEGSLIESLHDGWQLPKRRDALLVGMLLSPLLFGWVFLIARAAGRFHNLELAAALVAVAALAGVSALGGVGLAAYRALRRREAAHAPRGLVVTALALESSTSMKTASAASGASSSRASSCAKPARQETSTHKLTTDCC